MKKLSFSILIALFPLLAQAAGGSLTFAPPPTDVSVIFLSNIFGVVDGVLNGTGSQIMGAIFGVFNAAVLALGGIVIMYTLMVSTVNTAHEGQMLGQKWSSMWVPVRSTLGLSLLIPKASGYCLMQTFFMWVVVQGVGAADKVWDAALGYLNRGGVIVQQQINPITSLMGGGWSVANGAAKILYGETCMVGLQTVLTNQRQGYLKRKSKDSGPCYLAAKSPNSKDPATKAMNDFCNTPVPDLLGTVNAVSYQSGMTGSPTSFTLPMPYFGANSSSPYAILEGVCGSINWNTVNAASLSSIQGIGSAGMDTTKLARATAIQQMYINLSFIAKIMVNNNPALTPVQSTNNINKPPFAPFATNQFGIPTTANGTVCPAGTLGSPGSTCTGWGTGDSGSSALFNGTQFQGAVAAYNAIMLPTLNLLIQAKNSRNASGQRAFIQKAMSDGWMLAGSYFFNLASINSANTSTGGNQVAPTDMESGLGNSVYDNSNILKSFANNTCQGPQANLCRWFLENSTQKPDSSQLALVAQMMDGSPTYTTKMPDIPTNNTSSTTQLSVQQGKKSSNVYGFVNNSLMIRLPGQPGTVPPNFVLNLIPSFAPSLFSLPPMNYGCGEVTTFMFGFCLMQMIGQVIYNVIVVNLFQFFLDLIKGIVDTVIMAFLALPLTGMAQIFQNGVAFIKQPDVNPIIALANMGTNYINFAADLWMYLLMMAVTTSIMGPFAVFVFALMMMAMPLLMAWLSTMVSIGFLTAYYIPFLPYMIFTFGSIAWLMAVVEAMVAAPIVALGVTHPEGEGPFGKGEQAIMILMNVFLRPSLMIIGYIAGIILSYVSVWVINAGFSNVLPFIQGPSKGDTGVFKNVNFSVSAKNTTEFNVAGVASGYTGWAGIYGFFFSILIYTTLYITVVQKAFSLIGTLPDKVLRWIGGQAEQAGQEATGWADESKKQVEGAGDKTGKAQGQMGKDMSGKAMKGISSAGEAGPKASATPSKPD